MFTTKRVRIISNIWVTCLLTVITLHSNIKFSYAEVSVPSSVEGLEGQNASVTVTWTTESIFIAEIGYDNGKSPYSTKCVISGSQTCNQCSKIKGSNIEHSCADKQIIWTFAPLEQKNNGLNKIEFSTTSGDEIIRDLSVAVLAAPKTPSLSCHTTDMKEDFPLNCTCTAVSGNPKSPITWSLTGVDITGQSQTPDFEPFQTVSSNLSQVLRMEDNGGQLMCEVKNQHGSVNKTLTLNVKYKPRIKSINPSSFVFNESETVKIECETEGNPSPQVKWKFPDDSETTGKTLQITSIKKNQEGSYSCSATNDLGVVSQSINITVQYAPSCDSLNGTKIAVTDSLQNLDLVLGCSVTSKPSSNTFWIVKNKNGTTPIDESTISTKYTFNEMKESDVEVKTYLTILSADKEDEGTYTCKTVNSLGSCESNINIAVPSEPETPTGLKVETHSSTELKFLWTPGYDGGYPQTFRVQYWSENSENSTTTTEPFIIIKISELRPDSSYSFNVTASNKIGSSAQSIVIQYKTPKPTKPENVEFDSTSKLLKFSKTSIPYCVQVSHRATESDNWSIEQNCADSTTGEISVKSSSGYYRIEFCSKKFPDSCSEMNEIDIKSNTPPVALSSGAIAGIVIACLLVLGLIIFLIIYFVRIKPLKKSKPIIKGKNSKFKPSNNGHGGQISMPMETNMSPARIIYNRHPSDDSESPYAVAQSGAYTYTNGAFDKKESLDYSPRGSSVVDAVYKTAGPINYYADDVTQPPPYDKLPEIGISISDANLGNSHDFAENQYDTPTIPESKKKPNIVYEAVV